ncbi:sulfotransferase [Tateyamaria sp. Alg231-49]|uniref:sulfotransferase n=1 Tax=Tateyamaria sp. Alg231-49 TaxID=1922219 RepID=UPI000D55C1D0|nr:sulfotransferase [Tateyamaria sp. Alg231-49]
MTIPKQHDSDSPNKITFLIYCARSGSTFLANGISERRPSVVVIPETRLPLLIIWRNEDEIRAMDVPGLRAFFDRDMQLDNLGLSEAQLQALAHAQAGQGRRALLLGLFEAYRSAHGLKGSHFLVKNARVVFEQKALREVLPEAEFLEILRDPRGVANSMMTTRTVYSYGGPMAGGDPLKAARIWLQHRRAMDQLTEPVTQVRYEEVMANPATVAPLLTLLFGPEGKGAAPATAQIVSEKERSLHKLVGKEANASRLDAWKTNISARTGMAIEALLGEAMIKAGYRPHFTAGADADEIRAACAYQARVSKLLLAKHAARTGIHWVREAFKSPTQVLFRIENMRRNPR